MSVFKYFAPPEWDADVPEAAHDKDLVPQTRTKKKNKRQDTSEDFDTVKNKKSKFSDDKSAKTDDSSEQVPKKKIKRQVNNDDTASDKKSKLGDAKDVKSDNIQQRHFENFNKKNKKMKLNDLKSNGKSTKSEVSKNALKKLKRKGSDKNLETREVGEETKVANKELISNIQKKLEKRREERRENKKTRKQKRDAQALKVDGSIKCEGKESEVIKKKKQKSDAVSSISSPKENKTKVKSPEPPATTELQINSNIPKPLTQTEMNRRRRRKKNKTIDSNITPNKKLENGDDETEDKKLQNGVVKSEDEQLTLKQISGKGSMKKNGLKCKFMNILTQNLQSQGVETANQDDEMKENGMENNVEKKRKRLESKPKTLRERMMEKLKGARFRYLNEQMYSKESKDAKRLFNEDPKAFAAYHDGYRQQVNKWPLNPLDIIIKDISKLPKEHVIADLGCGDARLSKSVPHKVHSFDLVSLDPCVQACDMAHTPLLTGQVNIVVFCLSLMGTNLKDYVIEANRILKLGGLMKIAEVESRFEKIEEFTKEIQKYGFKLLKSDLTQNLFYFMDFKKEKDIVKRNKLPNLTLKPCLYKKR